MKIRDVEGNEIKACFSFTYRNLEISCSTIAAPNEIVVFGPVPGNRRDKYYRASSIPDAIWWIDEFQRQ